MPQSTLDKLKEWTRVVIDTGDFDKIKALAPHDATTNPSLLLQAVQMPAYAPLINKSVEAAKKKCCSGKVDKAKAVDELADELTVAFGCEILQLIPGVVSTEVDARLSFDKLGSIAKARRLIEMYEARGFKRERILIKMASTWEGCEAAKVLQKEGINCNMTLLFSMAQAVAAAEAGAFLVSPFVGRILDWHRNKNPSANFEGAKDPGVVSVKSIYNYYKHHGYSTVVMGASFRNVGEIKELAGCDRLTISPKLLQELADEPLSSSFTRRLDPAAVKEEEKIVLDESTFRLVFSGWHCAVADDDNETVWTPTRHRLCSGMKAIATYDR